MRRRTRDRISLFVIASIAKQSQMLEWVEMAKKTYFIYIMTNQHHQVLYTGVTNDLYRRVSEHKEGKGGLFTSRYHVNKLVYYELIDYVNDALEREKQIKGGSRQKKIELIYEMNPEWADLFDELQF